MHEIAELEQRLLQPEFRRDSAAVSLLLAPEFREFGSSGRVYNKEQVLELLATEASGKVEMSDFLATNLTPDIILATYRNLNTGVFSEPPIACWRSSLWIRREGRWQMIFHQGSRIV